MKSENYIIGMDGGGTKTHAIIADTKGAILKMHFGGPSNFQIIGVEKAAETIFSLIEMCCGSVGCTIEDIVTIVCGLSGAGRIGDQQRMAEGLTNYASTKKSKLKKVVIESDARIALEGAFKGSAGIILIAGTGSIAFGKDRKGVIHRVGGWGRVLGDEGSGYFLGRSGLTAVTRHLDGRGEKTKLTAMIAKEFELKDQTAIINAVYKNNFDVASVAPLVLIAAEKKDPVCLSIAETSVIDLADHITVAAKKISSSSAKKAKVCVSLIGGLISNDTLLSRFLRKHISAKLPGIEIIEPMSSPAYGAVLLGMKKQ